MTQIKKICLPYSLSHKATGRHPQLKLGSKPRKRTTWHTENKGAHNKRDEGNLQKHAKIPE